MDRILNFLFILILAILFVVTANPDEQIQLLVALILAAAVGLLAFSFQLLTLDGAHAAVVVGTITFGIGGATAAIILFVFFLTGTWLSKVNYHWNKRNEGDIESGRRTGLQVWANGFWFSIALIIYFVTKQPAWYVVGIAALAVGNADTWATEVGTLTDRLGTRLITNFKPVPSGVNGGVSLNGTLAALLGSLLLAAVYGGLAGHDGSAEFLIIAVTGFLGCIADSYFGALVQSDELDFYVPGFTYEKLLIGNNMVNWMATGVGAALAFLGCAVFLGL